MSGTAIVPPIKKIKNPSACLAPVYWLVQSPRSPKIDPAKNSASSSVAAINRAWSNSSELGQFNARYSAKSLRAIRIAIQTTAIVSGLATMYAAPYDSK